MTNIQKGSYRCKTTCKWVRVTGEAIAETVSTDYLSSYNGAVMVLYTKPEELEAITYAMPLPLFKQNYILQRPVTRLTAHDIDAIFSEKIEDNLPYVMPERTFKLTGIPALSGEFKAQFQASMEYCMEMLEPKTKKITRPCVASVVIAQKELVNCSKDVQYWALMQEKVFRDELNKHLASKKDTGENQ